MSSLTFNGISISKDVYTSKFSVLFFDSKSTFFVVTFKIWYIEKETRDMGSYRDQKDNNKERTFRNRK